MGIKTWVGISLISHFLFLLGICYLPWNRNRFPAEQIIIVDLITLPEEIPAPRLPAQQKTKQVLEKNHQQELEAMYQFVKQRRRKLKKLSPTPQPLESRTVPENLRDKFQEPAPQLRPSPAPPHLQIRVDQPFTYAYYLDLIHRQLSENWQPPPVKPFIASRPIAILAFRIDRNGRIYNIVVERSSGDAAFDQSAVTAVSLASPFAPLPGDYDGEYLGVHVPFTVK